jgi:hypothetical protein
LNYSNIKLIVLKKNQQYHFLLWKYGSWQRWLGKRRKKKKTTEAIIAAAAAAVDAAAAATAAGSRRRQRRRIERGLQSGSAGYGAAPLV